MSIFGMTSVVGIALGPFIGGAIQTNQDPLNWHWIFWIQLIVCGGLLPVFWFLLRETRGDVILMKKAKKIRKETGRDVYAKAELDKTSILTNVKVSFLRPTKMLVTEFVVISFTLWVSFGKSRQLSFRSLAKFQLPVQYPPNVREKVSHSPRPTLMLAMASIPSKRLSFS
jgi:MFS family permease